MFELGKVRVCMNPRNHYLNNGDDWKLKISAHGANVTELQIMFVWVVASFMNMPMYMDMVLFTFVDVAVVDLVENVGGVAEEIPVMGNNYLVQIEILQNFYESAGCFWIKVVCWFVQK